MAWGALGTIAGIQVPPHVFTGYVGVRMDGVYTMVCIRRHALSIQHWRCTSVQARPLEG